MARVKERVWTATALAVCACGSTQPAKPFPATTIAPHYSITAIDGPPGADISLSDITNDGVVVGYYEDHASNHCVVFTWTKQAGRVDRTPADGCAFPMDSNDGAKFITRDAGLTGSNIGGTYALLPDPDGHDGVVGPSTFLGSGINDSDVIVGTTTDGRDYTFSSSAFTRIEAGSDFVPDRISNAGVIAGHTSQGLVTWADGALTVLGDPGGIPEAMAMNDAGTIAGHFWPGNLGPESFVWMNGAFHYPSREIGTLAGAGFPAAFDVNNGNVVVGMDLSGSFAWTLDEGYVELENRIDDLSGWDTIEVGGINDHGEIVGAGRYTGASGTQIIRGFLLTPQ